jgi:acetylornithine deacetylase
VYFQFVPEEDMAAVVRQIEESLRAFEAGDPFFSRHPVEWLPLLEVPLQSHELENTHPWVDCMSTSAAAVLGRTAVVTAAPYPCDAGLLQREFGIPTLVFGPCGGGAHNPNEYVEFDSVLETAAVILDAALHWAGG